VLKPSIEEVNEYTDIEISMGEKKEGRTVTHIVFKIKPTEDSGKTVLVETCKKIMKEHQDLENTEYITIMNVAGGDKSLVEKAYLATLTKRPKNITGYMIEVIRSEIKKGNTPNTSKYDYDLIEQKLKNKMANL
jgi:plasmid replication initiation protein